MLTGVLILDNVGASFVCGFLTCHLINLISDYIYLSARVSVEEDLYKEISKMQNAEADSSEELLSEESTEESSSEKDNKAVSSSDIEYVKPTFDEFNQSNTYIRTNKAIDHNKKITYQEFEKLKDNLNNPPGGHFFAPSRNSKYVSIGDIETNTNDYLEKNKELERKKPIVIDPHKNNLFSSYTPEYLNLSSDLYVSLPEGFLDGNTLKNVNN